MKKTLIVISAIALSISVFASGNPDKASTCNKDAVVKEACCMTDGVICPIKQADCKLDQAACEAKQAACDVKTEAEKAACIKDAAAKNLSCGGCPLSK